MKQAHSNNNISMANAIGIDVFRDTFDVCIACGDHRPDQYLTIANTEAEIIAFAQTITGYTGKIIMESTGRHHLLAAILLSEKDFDVRIINPLITQKYAQGTIRKVKTDHQDAKRLARP